MNNKQKGINNMVEHEIINDWWLNNAFQVLPCFMFDKRKHNKKKNEKRGTTNYADKKRKQNQ